jgi:hypothetical protein
MPLQARIQFITLQAFEAAKRGDKSWRPCEGQPCIDLDIFWHAIHYLLTGDSNVAFLQSGVQVQEVSEHCEVHSPQDIAALDARLSKTTVSELMSTFDSKKFDSLGIYRGRWTVPTDVSEPYTFKVHQEIDKQNREAIQGRLVQFIAAVKHAAEKGLGFFVIIM